MKYALLYGIEDLRIEEKPIPRVESQKVLIKVEMCGICGTDILIYTGKFPVHFPYSPGHEYCGTVEETGEAVRYIKPGDRVVVDPNYSCGSCYYCIRALPHLCENQKTPGIKSNGGFAEYVAVPERIVHKIPDALSMNDAVLTESLSCALHALDLAGSLTSRQVCILGGGTMGMLTLELVKSCGAGLVILSEPVAARRTLAKEIGADIVVDPMKEDLEKVVRGNTSSYGIDVVLETAGLSQTVEQAMSVVRRQGRVILIGICPQDEKISISPFKVIKDELCIMGSFLNPHTFPRAINLLAEGKIKAGHYLGGMSFPLSKIKEAFELCRKGRSLKVVIELN